MIRRIKRDYGNRQCQYCGHVISNAGFASVGHMRKHVRQGLATEHKCLNYSKGHRLLGTYIDFRPTKEGKQAIIKKSSELGQGLLEYALIMILVALIVIVILALLGPAVGNMFSNIISNI